MGIITEIANGFLQAVKIKGEKKNSMGSLRNITCIQMLTVHSSIIIQGGEAGNERMNIAYFTRRT